MRNREQATGYLSHTDPLSPGVPDHEIRFPTFDDLGDHSHFHCDDYVDMGARRTHFLFTVVTIAQVSLWGGGKAVQYIRRGREREDLFC